MCVRAAASSPADIRCTSLSVAICTQTSTPPSPGPGEERASACDEVAKSADKTPAAATAVLRFSTDKKLQHAFGASLLSDNGWPDTEDSLL